MTPTVYDLLDIAIKALQFYAAKGGPKAKEALKNIAELKKRMHQ